MRKQVTIEDDVFEDEISISDILSKLWRRRGLILAITLLSLGLGIIYLFSSATVKRTPVTLFVELTSIKNGKYPNGAEFSPMDLKSPDVLRVLIEKYKPKDESKFGEAIAVNYGSDLMLGVHESYKLQLGAKGLTAADLQKINTDYKTALDEVARRGLEITFDYQLADLTKDEGRHVTNDLPRIWNEVYLKKYKVLIDPQIAEIATAPNDISLSTATALIELSRKMSTMMNGLKILIQDNRYTIITNPEGSNAFDVLRDLDFFRNIYLLPMIAASVLKADPSSQAYAQSIRLQINELDRNIASLNELSQQVINYQRSSDTSENKINKTTEDNLQLSDSTLSEILKLSNQAALSDFLKDTLNSKRELSFKRSELQAELERLTSNSTTTDDEEYTNSTEKKISKLFSNYQSLIDKIRSSATFNTQSFYTPVGKPEPFASKWPDKSLLILALTTIMGLVLSTGHCLAANRKKSAPKSQITLLVRREHAPLRHLTCRVNVKAGIESHEPAISMATSYRTCLLAESFIYQIVGANELSFLNEVICLTAIPTSHECMLQDSYYLRRPKRPHYSFSDNKVASRASQMTRWLSGCLAAGLLTALPRQPPANRPSPPYI